MAKKVKKIVKMESSNETKIERVEKVSNCQFQKKMLQVQFTFLFDLRNWICGFNWYKMPKMPIYIRLHFGPFSSIIKLG